MATIDERRGKFMARIRRRGAPMLTRTFQTREQAEEWANAVETEIRRRKLNKSSLGVELIDPIVNTYPRLPRTVQREARPGQSGVYLLFKGSECIYIGQSHDIADRMRQHRAEKDFDVYVWMPVDKDEMSLVEMMLIAVIKPKLNTTGIPRIIEAWNIFGTRRG